MARTIADLLILTGIRLFIMGYLEPSYLVACTNQDPLPRIFLDDFHERMPVKQWQPLPANTLALETTASIRCGSRDFSPF